MVSEFSGTAKNNKFEYGWKIVDGDTAKFLAVEKNEQILLVPERKKSGPALNISTLLLDVTDSDLRKLFQNTLYDGLTLKAYSAKTRSEWFTNYTKTRPQFLQEENDNVPSFNWEFDEYYSGEVRTGLIVVKRQTYEFTGGAHGNSTTTYFVFDTQGMSKVRLSDIMIDNFGAALKKIIEEAIRIQYGIDQKTPLTAVGFFENSIDVTENFFLSTAGLGFSWNPYEIAPYVMGTITVILQPGGFENLLNRKGKDLLALIR